MGSYCGYSFFCYTLILHLGMYIIKLAKLLLRNIGRRWDGQTLARKKSESQKLKSKAF